MNVDAAGVVRETGNALSKLASRANAPIFTYDDSYFQGAIVGGPMFSVLDGRPDNGGRCLAHPCR